MSRLDEAVEAARLLRLEDTAVSRAVARARVAAVQRSMQRDHHWRWFALATVAAAGAAVAVALLLPVAAIPETSPSWLGNRVSLIGEPGSEWMHRVGAHHATHLDLIAGRITVRLYPGERAHRLLVRAGVVTAEATGTVYAVEIRDGQVWVEVAEGTVEVRTNNATHSVNAGNAWEAGVISPAPMSASAKRLLAADPPVVPPWNTDQLALRNVAAPAERNENKEDNKHHDKGETFQKLERRSGRAKASAPTAAPAPKTNRSVPEALWRRGRDARTDGRFRDATERFLEAAATDDKTWAPLALAELARLHQHPLEDPAVALHVVRRFLATHPKHILVPEMRAIGCAAARDLGKDDALCD